MHSTHCALSVLREKYSGIIPPKAIAPLDKAIALSEEYHRLWWSIWWNTSKVSLKNKIKCECNQLAFDCYTNMILVAEAINVYVSIQTGRPPREWNALISTLSSAFEWIEKENPTEINQRQLLLLNPAMTNFQAHAHVRPNHIYSSFHASICSENSHENYALRHLYSLDNTKLFLGEIGWTADEIKAGIDYATIDVYRHQVYLHIPNRITKRGVKTKIKGISTFISKATFVDILFKKCWAKADPYKLEPGDNWDELIAKGNTGDFYEVQLLKYEVTCTCHAYSGIEKAFAQDAIASKHLMLHPICLGQIPDKHVFAAWKYLGAGNQRQYEYCWAERKEKATIPSYQEEFLEL
jgi:hypothetical protein